MGTSIVAKPDPWRTTALVVAVRLIEALITV
jgi:hypothetical protein